MRELFSKAMKLLVGSDPSFSLLKPIVSRPLEKMTERELIQLESQIGAQLFGPVPKGTRREFFNVDAKNWIWHEEWMDANGTYQTLTTRYEIQPQGILKVRVGEPYAFIEGQELKNLSLAVQTYYERSMREIYKTEPHVVNPTR
jgi:hypothetical protein